ncbi:transglycosylase SLT domain-containing protein [Synergistaceae bacterium OttesenSCG-928-D05]|nr:transglycosylase SLT domain-containing protein [Synergistaceae bacterium OttesenSCG-928-D05]
MRRIWRLRKIFIPQAVTVFILAAFIAGSPYVGTLMTAEATDQNSIGIILTTQITDKYGDQVTVKTNSQEFIGLEDLVAKAEAPAQEEQKLVPRPLKLDDSVVTALAKMDLTPDHIYRWIGEHPKTTLAEIEKMTPQLQAKVANVATFIRSTNKKLDAKTAWREAAALVHYCVKYNVSTELAVGVAKTESHFNPNLTSKAGARGVMQVMWKYHSGMLQAKGIAATKEHMYDPERGIEAGVLLLSRYIDAYGSVQKALSRYYGKMSNVYVRKVNNNMALLEKHSSNTGF